MNKTYKNSVFIGFGALEARDTYHKFCREMILVAFYLWLWYHLKILSEAFLVWCVLYLLWFYGVYGSTKRKMVGSIAQVVPLCSLKTESNPSMLDAGVYFMRNYSSKNIIRPKQWKLSVYSNLTSGKYGSIRHKQWNLRV